MSAPLNNPTDPANASDPSNPDPNAAPADPNSPNNAASTDSGSDGDDGKWDEEAAKRKFARMKADLDAAKKKNAELTPLAEEAEKRRKGELSESQRLAEEKAQVERERDELRAATVRRDAADVANLPAKFVKFITATDPEEALAQAKELAAELKTPESKPRADLRQGARGAPNSGGGLSRNDLLRQMGQQ